MVSLTPFDQGKERQLLKFSRHLAVKHDTLVSIPFDGILLELDEVRGQVKQGESACIRGDEEDTADGTDNELEIPSF